MHSCDLWLHWPVEEILLYHLDARSITFGRSTIEFQPLNEENCKETEWEEFVEAEGEIDYVLDLWDKNRKGYMDKAKKELESFWNDYLPHVKSGNESSEAISFEGQKWQAPVIKKIMLV